LSADTDNAEHDLPEATLAAIGQVSEHVYDVTTKDIRRYAQAIGDPNPLYYDEDYAKGTAWGGIVAPPLFCHSLAFEDVPADQLRPDGLPSELDVPLPTARAVGGGSTFDVGVPVRPGDVITVKKKIEDIYRKSGRSGDLIFVVLDATYVNQNGEVAAHERGSFVNR
jgi:acyl dehydratase